MPNPHASDDDELSSEAGDPQLLDLLRDVTEYADAIGEAALFETSLSLSASGLLIAICRDPGITIAQLSRQIPRTQQTIGQVVARLHKLGLIDRRLGDGRGIALYPSDAGRELAETARNGERAAELRLRAILGEHRQRALVDLLADARPALRDALDEAASPTDATDAASASSSRADRRRG